MRALRKVNHRQLHSATATYFAKQQPALEMEHQNHHSVNPHYGNYGKFVVPTANDTEFQPFPHFATSAIHVGAETDQYGFRPVVTPISLATTFQQTEPGVFNGFDYSRSGNPTRNSLEKTLAALENGKHALCFSSGLGAMTNVIHLLDAGDEVISMNDLYGGSNRYFRLVASKCGIKVNLIDCTSLDKVRAALTDKTKLVWLETPTNPTLCVVDIQGVADVVKKFNKDIIVVVDNTFMSSYFQRPLDLGADMVHHSLTKYMNGHTDVVQGCVVVRDDELYKRLKFLQNSIGAIPSPFDCYMVQRGLKTLHLRMQEHMKNGLAVAKFLEQHPCVEKVVHPGLPSHPQYELMKRQCRGYSGMLSFYIKGGLQEAREFLKGIKIFTLAESLGGYESLAEHPGIMTHASVPEDQRKALGISDTLIRLSVGLENIEDLLADLDQALSAAVFHTKTAVSNGQN
ncbi:cystathionine gamma-lyase-like [Paramacrobiotus metropolitanus]|uniref:cystathionine gamma-lyase-like n=1 Tax=Paramacrobiotus metropolitanus TaxID=2943436 RepID=UPI00244604BE|nr:cystathionine gamma-lyase-like [Paramacrobiotus metropolitanus]